MDVCAGTASIFLSLLHKIPDRKTDQGFLIAHMYFLVIDQLIFFVVPAVQLTDFLTNLLLTDVLLLSFS